MTRRRLLVGVGASVVLVACRNRSPGTTRVPTPDERARDAAASAERALVDEYGVVLVGYPLLAARLAPLAAHHRSHLAVLVHDASPSPTASAPPAAPETTPAAALRRLQTLELRLSRTHLAALPDASPELALLLASLAAAAAANAAELGRRP